MGAPLRRSSSTSESALEQSQLTCPCVENTDRQNSGELGRRVSQSGDSSAGGIGGRGSDKRSTTGKRRLISSTACMQEIGNRLMLRLQRWRCCEGRPVSLSYVQNPPTLSGFLVFKMLISNAEILAFQKLRYQGSRFALFLACSFETCV